MARVPLPPSKIKTKARRPRHFARGPCLLGLLLAGVILLVFWPVRNCGFVGYDDSEYFTSNSNVLNGLTLDGLRWALTTGRAANWHPLTWLSLMLDVQLFGPGPTGPHVTNLLFHVANAVLLFCLFWQLTGALGPSFFVAALFGLHPLHVESVAWVSERKDVLSTFFFLLALLAYGRYAKARALVPASHSALFYALALLLFALGLASKPMVVSLPFVMLLVDYWPLQRWPANSFRDLVAGFRRLVWEKTPFFALSAASCVLTLVVQAKGGAIRSLAAVSLSGRLENALVSYPRYLGKTFSPVNLSVIYPLPAHWPGPATALAGLLVAGGFLAALGLGRRLPFLVTGWLWFVGTLIPVIGLVQVGNQSMADRYTYVPLIGIFVALAWGAREVLARWRSPWLLNGVLAVGVLLACGLRSRDQIGYWENGDTLFRHAMAATDNNDMAVAFYQNHLGAALYRQGRTEEAMDCYRQAIAHYPQYELAHNNLGLALAARRQYDEAIQHYQRALELSPHYANAYVNYGKALTAVGRIAEAIAQYREALEIEPHSVKVLTDLGWILLRQGQSAEAIECFRNAIRFDPHYLAGYQNLANALARQGRLSEAEASCFTAVQLDPESPECRYQLGMILLREGKRQAAREQFAEALQLKPDYLPALRQLQATGGAAEGSTAP